MTPLLNLLWAPDHRCRGAAPMLVTALAAALLLGPRPVHAIVITPTNDAEALANTLFLNQASLSILDVTLSSAAETAGFPGSLQAGTYENLTGTYGLPSPGIVLSTGNVSDYALGDNFSDGTTTAYTFDPSATPAQETLLDPITGDFEHFDVVQLDISFFSGTDSVTFFATFGSEEFAEFVGSPFVDGFGLYVNGENVAAALPTGGSPGDPLLTINIDHPDMTAIPGTELDGVLAPNGNPVLRFDVPVNSGQANNFTIILADTSDSSLDSTVYLSSFFAEPEPGNSSGESEFDPLLPSNPPDPVTGAFEIVIPDVDPGETVWVDPPVAVGYTYDAGSAQFASITAPSLATVADLDGYTVTAGGATANLLPGATLDFLSVFGLAPSSFTLTGIDPTLGLDPANPLAFPVGVAFTSAQTSLPVTITPISLNTDPTAVPLPSTVLLLGAGLAAMAASKRWRRRIV